MIEIKGTVDRIIYRNEENGYTVAKINIEDGDLTIVGDIIEIKISMEYTFKGDFIFHKKYGEQFKFESVEQIIPSSEKGIVGYLSSGIIPYIGEKTAQSIYNYFKENTLKIIEEEPGKLIKVDGIGPTKLKKIVDSLNENKGYRDLVKFLNQFDIGNSLALKIYKEYSDDAISIIKENPYKLAEDIRGLGFKRVDLIARSMGNVDGAFRARAALKYTLFLASLEGHSYLPKDLLIQRAKKLASIAYEDFENEVASISLDNRFYVYSEDGETYCYYAPYLKAENYISGKLKEILKYKFKEDVDVDTLIKSIEERQNIKFAKKQIEAVKYSVNNGLVIITGGPGTGKTTTLKAIIEVFELMEKSVKLAAPTGRAAKRMKEATSREASTIHRLLEIGVSDEEFINYGYEEETSLECDVLIVDEVSMVDLNLMNTLLHAIEVGTRLILVGDKDQLPSVGPGNVLRDLIASDVIEVVNLNEIFRQSKESMIIKNAHLINNGLLPEISNSNDFFMISENSQEKSAEIITELVYKRLPSYYGVEKSEIQVLAPMKKGQVGVVNLNKKLQSVLNPSGKELKMGENIFRLGDKVMQTKNNYDLEYKIESDTYLEEGEGVFNGDIGYIDEIDEEEQELYVLYDGVKRVKYSYTDLDELMLSYACTIHKSQGSEFEIVIIPVHFAPPILLTRNLIYTAITRAKKLVVLVGQYKYLEEMIKNNKVSMRFSNLTRKLKSDENKELFNM
ncbi:MAG: SF1B family DNA helicase RecD2 [Peptoniphilaceae bacterium]